jgi:hypothetical protein
LLVTVLLAIPVSGCRESTPTAPEAGPSEPGTGPLDGDYVLGWAPDVRGDWSVTVETALDTCGIGPGTSPRSMNVVQYARDFVMTPVDDAEICLGFPLSLSGTSASAMWSGDATDEDGDCTVRFMTSFGVSFGTGSYLAAEDTRIVYVSGDCGGFTTACDWQLVATAEACRECAFECTEAPVYGPLRIGGPLGWALDVPLDGLTNEP